MTSPLGTWLKEARRRKGWTQERLGVAVDLTKAQVSRIESGAQGTKLSTLLRIAEALGIPIGEALLAYSTSGAGSEGPIRYVTDPDAAELLRVYESLPPAVKRHVRNHVVSTAEMARQLEGQAEEESATLINERFNLWFLPDPDRFALRDAEGRFIGFAPILERSGEPGVPIYLSDATAKDVIEIIKNHGTVSEDVIGS